jgi:23S rRNA pseudouridine1911/1915/1917 synthase
MNGISMKNPIFEITLTLQPHEPFTRLDRFLRDYLIQHHGISLSRSELKKLFEDQGVLLSGLPTEAATLLRPGELKIQIIRPLPMALRGKKASPALQAHAEVLHEDSHLLILNKPSGLPSVPHSTDETETAVGVALAHCPALASIGRSPLEPGLLHRLDTETSGVLVFAKTQSEFDRLLAQWKTPQTSKIYRAVIERFSPIPEVFPHLIDLPLGHDLKSSKKMRVATQDQLYRVRGKPLTARTNLLRAQKIPNSSFPHTPHELFDLTVQIYTGVMHQIRVHLSANGWPILGDPVYHPNSRNQAPNRHQNSDLTQKRLWLHASIIHLPLASGKTLEITAPLPEDWPSQTTLRKTETN